MFQIDEKVLSDSRSLITIQGQKHQIDHLTKNGTINYTMHDNNLWLTTPKVRTAYISRKDTTQVYDKILIARDGLTIDSTYEFDAPQIFNDNVEIKKDLVVRGNFTVEGDTTIIDTPRLSIEDNIIELNKNEVGNGISLKRSGSAIKRGQKPFARSLYDEDNKAFVFDTNTNMDGAVANDSWVAMGYAEKNGSYEQGEFRARFRLSAPHGKFSDSLSVGNIATLNNLTVIGDTNLQGPTVASTTTINGVLTVNANATFNNLLTANKVATFNDNVAMEKVLSVKGTSTLNGLATLNNGMNITNGGASIIGNTSINGILDVLENAGFGKDIVVSGDMSSSTADISETLTTRDMVVNNYAEINGDTVINGDLEVNDHSVFNSTVRLNDKVTVNAASDFNGSVSVNNNNVIITSNSSSNGNLLVGGDTNLQGTLDVDGTALFDSDVTMNGSLLLNGTDISARNVTVDQDFRVRQGDGNGLRFWDSDNYKIYMSAVASNGRLDSSSDYNMYFKMSTGSNRGFVFKNGSTNVAQIEGSGQVRTVGKIISKGYDVLTRENEGHKADATGINADKLDSLHATDFLRRNVDTDTSGAINFTTAGKAITFSSGGSIFKSGAITIKTDNAIANGFKIVTESNSALLTVVDNITTGLSFKGNKVWHMGNQGPGSGLDADTLDGRQATYFATANHLHDDRYIRNDEVNLKGKYKIEYNEDYDCLDFMYMGDTP